MSKLLVGRYDLEEKIGEGGMAVVYRAKDRLLNRNVAVKILRPEFTKDAQFVESFRKESQAAAGLQHPNIVSVYDVGREGNIHFIVMEYVDGKPLSDLIKETAPMNYKEVVRIAKQVATALSVAHKHNIIHRDIKPHNIMMTSDGTAKLGDFGIAKAISDSTLTETSKIIGSVHYFSPEQARGAYVDERSDIYSLGIIIYEMLTGKVPFDGDNPVQVALMHINDDVVPPSKLVAGIPPLLEKLVMRATDKFQTNRYGSADEMLEDMENIEFVTRMVGDSIFTDEDVENFRENNRKRELQKAGDSLRGDKEKEDAVKKPADPDKKKKRRIIILIAIIAAVAVILGAVLISGSGKATVPDVKGKTYEEAEEALTEAGFVIEEGDTVPSDTVEEGKIVSQTPKALSKEKKGTTVKVDISSGKPKGEVPNMVGKYYDDNTDAYIRNYGFQLGSVTYEKSDDYEKNQIMRQDPSSGSSIAEDTPINLVVCSGKLTEEVEVPSLTGGITYDEAKQKLTDAGLQVGKVEYKESNVYSSGYVMWQQYEPGTKIKQGSTVDIQISKGKPSEQEQNTDDGSGGDSGETDNSGEKTE